MSRQHNENIGLIKGLTQNNLHKELEISRPVSYQYLNFLLFREETRWAI